MRRSPRFEVHAAARFKLPNDEVIMRARNISMTGALLATEASQVPKFPVGSEHSVSVFASAEPKEAITVVAKVVRHDANAIVIDWSADVEASFRVALLIATLPASEVS